MDGIYLFFSIFLLSALSFANGSNDVSKAIATLAGSGVASLQKAIYWGSLWTAIGSISGAYWGIALIKNLTERLYTTNASLPMEMAFSIALAPIIWILLSTFKAWPVSTTHAVVGGIIGAGVSAFGIGGIAWKVVLQKIALPLLISPFAALLLAIIAMPFLTYIIGKIDKRRVNLATAHENNTWRSRIRGRYITGDHFHWFTSGLLSFARGLNDTPKLIAVTLPIAILSDITPNVGLFTIAAIAMSLGGILAGHRITEVLSFNITKMDHKQGFTANMVAAFLVIGASRWGMPVSTTHVSSLAIMGVGVAGKERLQKNTIKSMLFAWFLTVPAAALLSSGIFMVLGSVFKR